VKIIFGDASLGEPTILSYFVIMGGGKFGKGFVEPKDDFVVKKFGWGPRLGCFYKIGSDCMLKGK
jgi:hypothetical protein